MGVMVGSAVGPTDDTVAEGLLVVGGGSGSESPRLMNATAIGTKAPTTRATTIPTIQRSRGSRTVAAAPVSLVVPPLSSGDLSSFTVVIVVPRRVGARGVD